MNPPQGPESCVRCGRCNPQCPTFKYYLREDFSPRGRIFLFSQGVEGKGLAHCLYCGRCQKICPLGISFPKSYLKRLLQGVSSPVPLPSVPDLFFWRKIQDEGAEILAKSSLSNEDSGDVYLYLSCGLQHLYPKALGPFLGFIQKEALKIHSPSSNCCGILYLSLRNFTRLREFAQKNLSLFQEDKPVLTFCATCAWMFREVYPLLGSEFEALAQRTWFVLDFLKYNFNLKIQVCSPLKVLFHRPCHLNVDLTLGGSSVNYMIKDFCCGSGRLDLWLKGFQRSYRHLWIKELEDIDVLATACTGCFYNFTTLIKKPPLIKHWLEVLTLS